jgi:hypothetical protein
VVPETAGGGAGETQDTAFFTSGSPDFSTVRLMQGFGLKVAAS